MRQKGFAPIIIFIVFGLIGVFVYLTFTKGHFSIRQLDIASMATPMEKQVETTSATGLCKQKDEGLFTLKQSEQNGWCELSLPLVDYKVAGYRLIYPDNWNVKIVGAEGMNLIFNQGVKVGKDQELFIAITTSTLSVEQADKADYGFEMSEPKPLVDPNETYVHKRIENIGGKEVLNLLTKLDGKLIQRYFISHEGPKSTGLYMFEASGDNKEFLELLSEIISSIQFLK